MSAFDKSINALWIGSELSNTELLTILSFLKNGHEFNLWTYESIATPIPAAVIINDANQIIPFKNVFKYKYTNQWGHGKGSYAGFSDIFRYKLLYEKGGWWVDMDVSCLKPFDFEEEYVFRTHHDYPVVGNIMKCPKGSPLMKKCYEQALAVVTEDNRNWDLPIQILNQNITELQLSKYIKEISNQDKWGIVVKYLHKKVTIPENWYAIHWINEEWRRNGISRESFKRKSLLGALIEKYFEKQIADKILNNRFDYKTTLIYAVFKQIFG